MEATINLAQIENHTTLNMKSHRFEFRLFSNRKSKYDIDYYPICAPRRTSGIPKEVIQYISRILTADIHKIKSLTDTTNIILADLFAKAPKKSYKIWNERDTYLGTVKTLAPEDKLDEILLIHNPNASSYELDDQFDDNETEEDDNEDEYEY